MTLSRHTGNGTGGTALRQKPRRTSQEMRHRRQKGGGNGGSKFVARDGCASPTLPFTPEARASKCAKSTLVSLSTNDGNTSRIIAAPPGTTQAGDLYDASPSNEEESGENNPLTPSSYESPHRYTRSPSRSISPKAVPESYPQNCEISKPLCDCERRVNSNEKRGKSISRPSQRDGA